MLDEYSYRIGYQEGYQDGIIISGQKKSILSSVIELAKVIIFLEVGVVLFYVVGSIVAVVLTIFVIYAVIMVIKGVIKNVQVQQN